MRSRRENREVVKLGEEINLPVVSGGDRHGFEPNAVLNVSQAGSFEEFVQEIRGERRSIVMLMREFFEVLQLCMLENAWHALAAAPGDFSRRHWMTRVFCLEEGEPQALSKYTGTRFHRVIDKCRRWMALLASPALRPALRIPFLGNEEGGAMTRESRVALFCETFHEINGVALTVRQLVAFAKRQNRPLLAIHGGKNPGMEEVGSVRRVELRRARLSIGIDSDLEYDLFFWRYLRQIRKEILAFQPDAIHITSPGELGQIGAYLAHRLKIPLVASWHTNFHQFVARRLQKLMELFPKGISEPTVGWSQDRGLRFLLWFYGRATVTLAPTATQVQWLEEKLHRPSFLMPRGVDGELFNPQKRTVRDDVLRIGFVGRITPEKGVRLFQKIERALEEAGHREFRILIVGDGSEVAWLKQNLKHGEFLGVLRGEELARAYANMDLFVFPSKTDTFGNVIQESAASQVAAVVTNEGGPQHLVVPGITGIIAQSDDDFVKQAVELCGDCDRLRKMSVAAREKVYGTSWDAAFEMTYAAYRYCLPESRLKRSNREAPPQDA